MINIKKGNILNCNEDIIVHQEIWKDIKGYKGLYQISNLEWCNASQNNIHAYRNGLNKRNKEVLQYDMEGNFIKEWNSIRQAGKELGISFTQIGACARGELKKAHNYIWKYKEVY